MNHYHVQKENPESDEFESNLYQLSGTNSLE